MPLQILLFSQYFVNPIVLEFKLGLIRQAIKLLSSAPDIRCWCITLHDGYTWH